jgi:DinB superfamily
MPLEWIATMLARELRTLARELEAYASDAEIWATPPGLPNSAGTLTLHLCGNLQHFVGAVLGGTGYVRRRDAEFGDRGGSRAELIAGVQTTIGVVEQTLGAGRALDLAADYPDAIGGKFRVTTGDFLIHLAAHLAFHVGQIDYHRRLLTGSPASVGVVSVPEMATARPAS